MVRLGNGGLLRLHGRPPDANYLAVMNGWGSVEASSLHLNEDANLISQKSSGVSPPT